MLTDTSLHLLIRHHKSLRCSSSPSSSRQDFWLRLRPRSVCLHVPSGQKKVSFERLILNQRSTGRSSKFLHRVSHYYVFARTNHHDPRPVGRLHGGGRRLRSVLRKMHSSVSRQPNPSSPVFLQRILQHQLLGFPVLATWRCGLRQSGC